VPGFVVVRKDSYHDSVLLMRLSQALAALPGVEDATVAMGTPHNRELLAAQGYGAVELAAAGPNDLVIAARGTTSPAAVEGELARLLAADRPRGEDEARPASLAAAVQLLPEANLVLISVPGEHAAREARRALALGRHVMLFSDNVALEDEVALKREAVARGLLLMGPDCGTAIINGKPLAFANAVRRGPIGIVGAAGTGIQEISSCIHRLGGGVSQAIGTGGRDLSDRVGGLMTLLGIAALAADPGTRVLVVVSKPPSPAVAERVLAALAGTGKPCVVHFVGAGPRGGDAAGGVAVADSLAGAAEIACRLAGVPGVPAAEGAGQPAVGRAAELAARLAPGARLRGLFCGGTTGQEALALLARAGLEVRSNLHKQGVLRIEGTAPVAGHALLDLGDDAFTVGRPHPMIEPALRNERLALEAADPEVGLLLFDCVLGFGSHPDPAGLLALGVARERAALPGRALVAIASLTGTPDDPQDYDEQARRLAAADIAVEPDNRRAAALAVEVLRALGAGLRAAAPAAPGRTG
jgi:succinyl-CoA synthetase alpha subunit